MKIEKTKLEGCYIFTPTCFKDERGYFYESFNFKTLNSLVDCEVNFVQDNISFSNYGVLRGLHYQTGRNAQAKLVSVLQGKVLDVAVDIRLNSPTFGQYISVELSSENRRQLFVPRGFAHGFVVLSESAKFFYKVDNYYSPESEAGILFNDKELAINWQVDSKDLFLNKKDLELPLLKSVTS